MSAFSLSSQVVRPTLIGFLLLGIVASAILVAAWPATASAEEPASESADAGEALNGHIYVWSNGRLRPVSDAHVSTGVALTRTDRSGRFAFEPDLRTGQLSIVRPGYCVIERPVYRDNVVVILHNLIVRGIHIPFEFAPNPEVQRWVLDLVDRGLINSVVVDVKNESGVVFDIAATDTVRAVGATWASTNLAEFLETLQRKGVYRIGRVVTFLDSFFPSWHPGASLFSHSGARFIDTYGNGWSNPHSAAARAYNAQIGVAAAAYFEEIQYDYVRFPYQDVRNRGTEAERVAAINAFAREASEALHLAGAAISFDTFGQVSISTFDEGIGQWLQGIAPYLDYVSPMLYPSGWAAGNFGLDYPPAYPGTVIRESMRATVERSTPHGVVQVRPWLQDFHDYGAQGLYYNADQVRAQIVAAAETGGAGFMLWDTSLAYQETALLDTIELSWSPID